MKLRRCYLYSVIALLASQMVVSATQTAENRELRNRIQVIALTEPSIPIEISYAIARKVKGEPFLTYSIKNRSGAKLSDIEVVAFVVDISGRIKGGEGWNWNVDLMTDSSDDFPVILGRPVGSDDRIVLTVSRVSGEAGKFEVEPSNIINSLKSRLSGQKKDSPQRQR